jgi:FkbM family methyltransferase
MNKNEYRVPSGDRLLANNFYDEINDGFEYDHDGATIVPGDRVLDCGAYVGMFTDYAYRKGAYKVYSVEYDKVRYACLEENMTKIWDTLPTSIRRRADKPELYNRAVIDEAKDHSKEFDINIFLETNPIDFVKMDIEGAEWPCLLNLKDDTMKRVKKWAIEVHLGWSKDEKLYKYGSKLGRDYHSHYASKFIRVIQKFTENGFVTAIKDPHPTYDIVMLYAWKSI